LLTGKPKIDVPLKKKDEPKPVAAPAAARAAAVGPTGPVTSRCTIEENGRRRTFVVTLEPAGSPAVAVATPAPAAVAAAAEGTNVYSSFTGSVEVIDILAKVGQQVSEGSVVAAVEAMKAKHDVKAPCSGTVSAIHVEIGDEIDSKQPILTLS
ncbi:MAG: hypothetical protein JSU65_14415, partial [Candidatus Zixiibacteriota bacterium]